MKKIILLAFLYTQLFSSYEELLFNGNCITCHKINKSISAPSIIMIQKRYKGAFLNKKDFVNYMSKWVLKPDESSSLMQDQILKYELMPELGYQVDVLQQISSYIYETDFSTQH